ncbi:MAG TPA: GNAT family N-acetyltransferase [Balneolaceae bacterium]|nr:GNAT family N-acetyltransferase [Balneolaceae bacterium]
MTEDISDNSSDLKLRFAEEKDLLTILKFIEELAAYEKLSDQVVANEKQLREYLFGKKTYAEVILAEYNQKPVGFALFFHNFSTFLGKPGLYLEDLYVKESYRHEGFGTEILKYLAQIAVERDCGRFEWAVLDWNEPAIDFYEAIGAKPLNDWTTYRLTGEALKNLAKNS